MRKFYDAMNEKKILIFFFKVNLLAGPLSVQKYSTEKISALFFNLILVYFAIVKELSFFNVLRIKNILHLDVLFQTKTARF